MTITITIDETDLERQIAEAATLKNLSVQEYAREVLRASVPEPVREVPDLTERQRRVLAGRGALAGIGLSSERFMAEKAEEKEREERHWRRRASQDVGDEGVVS